MDDWLEDLRITPFPDFLQFYVIHEGVSIQITKGHRDKEFELQSFENESNRKDMGRKILCKLLNFLIQNGYAKQNDIMSLLAVGSDNGNLIKKIYRPMGFEKIPDRDGNIREDYMGSFMEAPFQKIVTWCTRYFDKKIYKLGNVSGYKRKKASKTKTKSRKKKKKVSQHCKSR